MRLFGRLFTRSLRPFASFVTGFLLLGSLYGFTRLVNLTGLPIFTDEAIYIRWSQIGAADAAWRFISLTDGKQPLFTWVVMALLRVFQSFDPLWVGRFASVLAGALSMIGMWVLTREIFGSRRIAFIASILYLVSPFALVYDRMALYDSMVATLFLWNLYFAIRLAKTPRLDLALILGMTLGAGVLNKTSGFLSLYLLPLTLIIFRWNKKNIRHSVSSLFRWFGLVALAGLLSQMFYSILRLSPFFHMIAQKDTVFIYPFSDWVKHPFQFLQGNLSGQFDWLRSYLTMPIFLASFVPLLSIWKSKTGEKILLYGYWIFPFVGLALFGRVLYPRFIFFMTMPLFVLAASGVHSIFLILRPRVWKIVTAVVLLFVPLWTDYFVIFDPLHAPIHDADRGQYIDSWPSGWGVPEVIEFIRKESIKGPVALFTEGTFGLMPASFEMYFSGDSNITISGIWPLPDDMPQAIVDSASRMSTFVVVNQSKQAPETWPLEQIAQYQKGLRVDRKLRLYKVVSRSPTYDTKE